MSEERRRFSIIDGSMEEMEVTERTVVRPEVIEPIYKETEVPRVTLDGVEMVEQRVIVGFRVRKEE